MGGPVGTLWDHICVIATGVESAVVWLGEGSEKISERLSRTLSWRCPKV